MTTDRPFTDHGLHVRVAALGGIALIVFVTLFFRLWVLQILRGAEALTEARANLSRVVAEPASRGDIVDRNGVTLVSTRRAAVLQIEAQAVSDRVRRQAARWGQQAGQRARRPKGRRGPQVPVPALADPRLRRTLARVARVIRVRPGTLRARLVRGLAQVPYANVTLTERLTRGQLVYLVERKDELDGLVVTRRPRRTYPRGALAAHVLGTTGEVSPRQLAQRRFDGVRTGAVVGQDGLEWTYDAVLRGRDGRRRHVVDAAGDPVSQRVIRAPRAGRTLRLTLDARLQRDGERALARAIAASGGRAGAFVALDPRDGAVRAIGSSPTFDPRRLQRPMTQDEYERLLGDAAGAPRFDRAVGAAYPTGSVFKPITAVASQRAGVLGVGTVVQDAGCIEISAREFCNAGDQPYGGVDLQAAMKVSSDVYFYVAGRDMNGGRELQRVSRDFGLGRRTGIDVPGEFAGLVPDRAWRAKVGEQEARCARRRKVRSCGISDRRPWSVGDNVNLSVGQGDLQATPLQMAVLYAAIANGGRVVQPHLGDAVQDRRGRVVERVRAPARRRVRIAPDALAAIRAGLRASTSQPGGTSSDVFAGWPHARFPVHGKTGTAERPPRPDQSWYAAYVPHPTRPLVVVTTVEDGGFGAEAAAPAARLLLSSWFGVPPKYVAGRSETR